MPSIEWIGTLIGIGMFFGIAWGYYIGTHAPHIIMGQPKNDSPSRVSEEDRARERMGLAHEHSDH